VILTLCDMPCGRPLRSVASLARTRSSGTPRLETDGHCSTGAGVNETRWLASEIHRATDVDQFLSRPICIQLAHTDSGVNLLLIFLAVPSSWRQGWEIHIDDISTRLCYSLDRSAARESAFLLVRGTRAAGFSVFSVNGCVLRGESVHP